jgi:hypothetical protein
MKQRWPHFILFIDLFLSTTHCGSHKLLLVLPSIDGRLLDIWSMIGGNASR